MMKQIKCNILFLLLTFTIVKTAFAQTSGDSTYKRTNANYTRPNTSYIALSIGAGIPHGNYALYDLTNTASGFAKTGFNAGISLAKVLWRRMGVSVMYRYQNNKIDEADLLSQTTAKYPNITWSITTTPWRVNTFMVGYYSSYPLDNTNKVFLDLKFMLGAVKVNSPELDLTGSQSGATATANTGISTAVSFAYCAGFGFKFDVDKDICILLHADYLQANPQFTNVPITSSTGNSTTQIFTQNISIISISTGVAFKVN